LGEKGSSPLTLDYKAAYRRSRDTLVRGRQYPESQLPATSDRTRGVCSEYGFCVLGTFKYNSISRIDRGVGKICIKLRMSTIQPNVEQPVSEEMALVRRAKRGDDQAFEELVRRYDRNVFRIAQHITQNREDAEDVVQEAFLKAYGNLAKFQEQSKFYTWLVRIAVNEALMKLRRRKPERTVSLDEDVKTEDDSLPREVADWSPNPEQMYNQAQLRDILTRTIQGLPSGFRTVFVLRDVEGLSTEETAQALELSIPAVKSRLLRARLQLRERLNRYFQKKASGDGDQ
jgi:RNA polymerase sigma-70 factor, ECF subfamily